MASGDMAVLYVRKECRLPHGWEAREEKRKEEEKEKVKKPVLIAYLCDPTVEEIESEDSLGYLGVFRQAWAT